MIIKDYFRYSIPHVTGRGSGLGNELIPWARAILIGSILGVKALPPAFGLNSRKYWKYFQTFRFDYISNRIIENVLPNIEFTEKDFYDYGGGSLTLAVNNFSEKHRLSERNSWVVTTKGMWGGCRHILEARDYMRSILYLSQYTQANLAKIRARLAPEKITIVMHVRLGDFKNSNNILNYQGAFNTSLPLEWYMNIARNIREKLNDKAQFIIISDGNGEEIKPLIDCCDGIITNDIPNSDISDLIMLVEADLLVCSVSSYSVWGAFLSDAPYLWFEPQLQRIGGFYSIWGHESRQQQKQMMTILKTKEIESEEITLNPRGIPVAMDGIVPNSLIEVLLNNYEKKRSIYYDLINYGLVKI